MIDEHAKVLLKSFARCLTLGISRDEHRLPLETAPHPLDRGRWGDFLGSVCGQPKTTAPDTLETAQDADQIRTLLVEYGVSPEGATFWAGEFRREREGLGR